MLASVCARKESYEQHRFESTNLLLLAGIEIEQCLRKRLPPVMFAVGSDDR
jgi:hypothetical protein